MRRHHQEVHVIRDRVLAQGRPALIGRAAEMREEILPVARAPAGDFALEQIDQIAARRHPLRHRRAGQRIAHRGDARLHLVDERLVDPFGLGPQVHAEEAFRRQIERQRLDRVVEAHWPVRPAAHLARDAAIELLGIMAHRLGLERHRKRAAIGAVLLEVHQHQPAREQQVEQRPPALFGREDFVAIEQHQLVRFGAEQLDRRVAERAVTIDMPVPGDHLAPEGAGVLQHSEGVADDRQPVITRNMRERLGGNARQPVRIGGVGMREGHQSLPVTYIAISRVGVGLKRALRLQEVPSPKPSPVNGRGLFA